MKNYIKINDCIDSLLYHYQFPKKQFHGYNNTWHVDWFDGRTAAVKFLKLEGFSRKSVSTILAKKIVRRNIKNVVTSIDNRRRLEFLKMVSECKFDLNVTSSRYNCTGIDWKAYHRPSSNGKGWVLIAPDEPGNNWYMEDAIMVKFLSNKFISA